MMNPNPLFNAVPNLPALLAKADHVDVKIVEGETTLREFVAGMFSFYPAWLKTLYRIRWGFVRLLGLKQTGIPPAQRMEPKAVPMDAGQKMAFFKVEMAQEEHYWLASAAEAHLTAYLGVVVEPLPNQRQRFYVLTIVYYHNWTGPVYFNVIRPFHHLVVGQMARAGVKSMKYELRSTNDEIHNS